MAVQSPRALLPCDGKPTRCKSGRSCAGSEYPDQLDGGAIECISHRQYSAELLLS